MSNSTNKYKITFSVFDYQEAESAEQAEAYAINRIANEFGIYFTEVAVMQVTELAKRGPFGIDLDEYYRLMAIEGRDDR